jgi:hypothetical protein
MSGAEPDELQRALAAARDELRATAGPELVERLIALARRDGARRLFEALDAEGRIVPCGQGCGWEGPWAIDSTLWPADRDRILGDGYRAPAQFAELEEQERLLGRNGAD